MADVHNRFKKAAEQHRVAPGGEAKPTIKEEVVEPKPSIPTKDENPLMGMIEPKPEGKSYGFYLSVEAHANLEKLAKKNKCSKSKALDALLRSLT